MQNTAADFLFAAVFFLFRRNQFSMPKFGIHIYKLGIYKPNFGIYKPNFGIENFSARNRLFFRFSGKSCAMVLKNML